MCVSRGAVMVSFAFHTLALFRCVSSSHCDRDDGTCASDHYILLQSIVSRQRLLTNSTEEKLSPSWLTIALRAVSSQHHTNETTLDHIDEPENAPRWYVSMIVLCSFIIIVLLIMLALSGCLQLAVSYQMEIQKQVLSQMNLRRRSFTEDAAEVAEAEQKQTKYELDSSELQALIAGDHKRFDALLGLANIWYSSDATLQNLLQRCSAASKLNLSSAALKQIGDGLLVLSRFAYESQQKTNTSLKPRERLQKAMRQILTQVRDCRAFKVPLQKDHQEMGWTDKTNFVEHLSDKYADGHKDSMHGGYKDTRLGKTKGSYFASDWWIDYSAIAFVYIYSQACACLYAAYLYFRFPKMYCFMGPWLLVSRGEAMAIIVLTSTDVILLCRKLMTVSRVYVSWSKLLTTILDKHVLIHRSIGVMLVINAFLHVLGHLKGSIPAIIGETDSLKIDQAFTYGTKIKFNFNSWGEASRCYPAVTGYCLLLILGAFWALSNERVRRAAFEYFQYPHMILICLWSFMLVAHGARQWLGIGVPLALVTVVPVVIYYFAERLFSIYYGQGASISNAVLKKHNVLLEIDIGDTHFHYETGMYCMLKVPEISEFQWHPFTIASAGGLQKFQLLFAVVGDWTTQLKELIRDAQSEAKRTTMPVQYPLVAIRGGYGAPAEGMKDCKNIVMVGAGVGATPFLSFLSNITHAATAGKLGNGSHFDNLDSGVFYWVSREPEDFVWVNHYNSMIRNHPKLKGILSLRLVLTKSLETSQTDDCSATEIALFWCGVQVALKSPYSQGLADEIGAPTQFGRPNWEKEFLEIKDALLPKGKYTRKDPLEVSVFACGNKMLVESLDTACASVSSHLASFKLLAEEF